MRHSRGIVAQRLGVGEVADDVVDPVDGGVFVGVVEDLADDRLGGPGEPKFAAWRMRRREQPDGELDRASTPSGSWAITNRRWHP